MTERDINVKINVKRMTPKTLNPFTPQALDPSTPQSSHLASFPQLPIAVATKTLQRPRAGTTSYPAQQSTCQQLLAARRIHFQLSPIRQSAISFFNCLLLAVGAGGRGRSPSDILPRRTYIYIYPPLCPKPRSGVFIMCLMSPWHGVPGVCGIA